MRTLPVILLDELIKVARLASKRWLWGDIVLKGSVHAFVASILAGLARLNALGTDAQLDPPFRQLTDPAQGQGGKGGAVIGANAIRQAVSAKSPLKPGSNRLIGRVLQGPTDQQIPREIVTERQRITAPPAPHQKISLEVRAPYLIRRSALTKRFTIRCDTTPQHTALDQPRTLKNLTGRRVCWPGNLGFSSSQKVHHLLRSPTLMAKLGLYQHLAHALGRLIGMTLRCPRAFRQRLDAVVLVALDPFVSGRSADAIGSTQFNLRAFITQPIGDKLYSLIHGTGLFPRHWQDPPCLCLLICKPCARFVL